MGHIVAEGKGQGALFPPCLEDLLPVDHACRVSDARGALPSGTAIASPVTSRIWC